jgi:hypothetical protein
MHDFEDEQNPLAGNGAEPSAGSGLEDEQAESEFVATTENEAEEREQ